MWETTWQRLLLSLESSRFRVSSYGPWDWFVVISTTLAVAIPLHYLIHYRSSIRKKVRNIESRLSRGLVYRDKSGTPGLRLVRALELPPDFVEEHASNGWQLISLGQYLSTLRANTLDEDEHGDLPKILERELEAAIGSILLRSLGPRFGAALLPMLGISKIDSWIGQVTSTIASWVASHIVVEVSDSWDPTEDCAAFPFSIPEVIAFVNINQKIGATSSMETSSLEWLRRGEISYSPTYANIDPVQEQDDNTRGAENSTTPKKVDLIPNPFVIEEHFEKALSGLEEEIRRQARVSATNPTPNADPSTTTDEYDPDDRSFPPPVPIDGRLLPGLHMGWGNAKCTHTKREILRNRLLAVLLNKLCYNYHLLEKDETDLFVVQYNGTPCTLPDEFAQVLMDTGHDIEVCPRSTITTFGIAACVKEDDGTWSNIPIAFFFRTGYERRDGRPAYFSAPHGGLDMSLRGPIVGDGNKCDIQFYVAIDGLCGWHSNHNADVPWLKPVSTTDIYTPEQTLQAVRMSGLLAVTFNSLATEMSLPFGGYGVLGVCNDSAAFIDFALRGETNMYPLISTGRFLFHSGRRLLELRNGLKKHPRMESALRDARRLVTASCTMDSDMHNSPSHLIGATRRYLANYPVSHFQLTEDSKTMMLKVAELYKDYVSFEKGTGASLDTRMSQTVPNFVNFLFNGGRSRSELPAVVPQNEE